MTDYLRGGKILKIDLSAGKSTTEPTSSYAQRFIGGKGINVKLLFDGVEPQAGAFDPGNVIVFGAGPLVGTPFPGACRLDIQARSPVTGSLGYAGMGGYFGARMKAAGYDSIVVGGRAEKPVYLHISNDKIEMRDASSVWSHSTTEAPEIIRQETGDLTADVISIGPAGEKLVIYASVLSPTGNIASRTGMGAVMGSKNLKAIAVNGTHGLAAAHPREFLDTCTATRKEIMQSRAYEEYHNWGLTRNHDTEMKNWYEMLGVAWKDSGPVSEANFVRDYRRYRIGCITCPVACFQGCEVQGAGSGIMKCSPPGDLTWDIRNNDMQVYWQVLMMCQRYGIDARAISNSLAWLMKLTENGIITAADTDGLDMKWGDAHAIVEMTRKIVTREGFGDLIAQGMPFVAEKIGKGADKHLFLAHDQPGCVHWIPVKSRVLRSAVSPVGGDSSVQPPLDMAGARAYTQNHDEAAFQEAIRRFKDRAEKEVGVRDAPDPRLTTGKAALIHDKEMVSSVCNISGACVWLTAFLGLPLEIKHIAAALTAGLGEEITPERLIETSMRLQTVERAFAMRLGLDRSDDQVSAAMFTHMKRPEKETRDLACSPEELEVMKDDYYRIKGWDVGTGMPTRESLVKQDLADVAGALGI